MHFKRFFDNGTLFHLEPECIVIGIFIYLVLEKRIFSPRSTSLPIQLGLHHRPHPLSVPSSPMLIKSKSHRSMENKRDGLRIRFFSPLSFEQEYPLLQTPIRSTLSATAPIYNGSVSSQPMVLPEQDTDLILSDAIEQDDSAEIERYLTEEIGCPIKLLSSKAISSTRKTFFRYFFQWPLSSLPSISFSFSLSHLGRTTPFFCPIETPTDLFRLLRWQNGENPSIGPLLVYASAHDAHEATDFNIEHNHFCLLRLQLPDCNLLNEHTLHLDNPSALYFDRMWIYTYDGWDRNKL